MRVIPPDEHLGPDFLNGQYQAWVDGLDPEAEHHATALALRMLNDGVVEAIGGRLEAVDWVPDTDPMEPQPEAGKDDRMMAACLDTGNFLAFLLHRYGGR